MQSTHSNMWVDKPWSDVTDDELRAVAHRLEDEKGGWVFHAPIDWNVHVPHISCVVSHPVIMTEWIERNSRG
jgi:hypothetical protein